MFKLQCILNVEICGRELRSVSLFRLASGSSYYSSAIVGTFRSSAPELAVVSESARLYRELHISGHDIGDYPY